VDLEEGALKGKRQLIEEEEGEDEEDENDGENDGGENP
jgi:hypothetical protein